MTRLTERIGRNLREARSAAGLSQERLAARAGVSARTVARLERGDTANPRSEEFERIAAALGTTTDDLMGIEDVKSSDTDSQDELTDEELDARIAEHLQDSSVMLDFMGKIRDPKRLSRRMKMVVLETLEEPSPRSRRRD